MPATREDLVKLAREAAGGLNRPSPTCEGTFTEPWGETKTVMIECSHSVRNPASYDPPEWVLDAMERAFRRGEIAGAEQALRATVPQLYPEGG